MIKHHQEISMIFVLLPAYNESQALPDLLGDIKSVEWSPEEKYSVIVVDDGSTDDTVSICKSFANDMPVEVICHGNNRGLGAAMMTGLEYCFARCEADDAVVTMDADNTHSPLHMPMMLHALRVGNDIVIASRYAPGGREIGLSPNRRILSRGASLMLRIAFSIPGAADYTCGYRAYSGRIIHRGFDVYRDKLIEESGFVCMAELLIKLGSIGAKVAEVPLVLRYDLKGGASKMKISRTIRSYLGLIFFNRSRIKSPEIREHSVY